MKPPLHHRPYGPGDDDYGRDGEMVGRLSYTLEQLDFWHTRALKAEAEAAKYRVWWERLAAELVEEIRMIDAAHGNEELAYAQMAGLQDALDKMREIEADKERV